LQTLSRTSSSIDTDIVEIQEPEIEFDNAAHCANLPTPCDVLSKKQKRLMRRGEQITLFSLGLATRHRD
jgi:hypothetical protein